MTFLYRHPDACQDLMRIAPFKKVIPRLRRNRPEIFRFIIKHRKDGGVKKVQDKEAGLSH